MSRSTPIGPQDTAGALAGRLAEIGAQLLAPALAAVERGGAAGTPQAAEGVTYARKITSQEARIDWSRPALDVDRQIRGLSPFPGAWFLAPQTVGMDRPPVRVKALLSAVEAGAAEPGRTLDDRLLVACGVGAVRILEAQREGRGAQAAHEFLRGFPIPAGVRLD